MKAFIAFFLIVTAVPSFAACEEFSEAFDDLINSEIQTNNNIIGYLNSNTQGWSEADNLISSGQLTRRTYNGAMRTNANRSTQNANSLSSRNNSLRSNAKLMKAELSRCIAEAIANAKQSE
jgi:hypothetical protein